MARCMNLKSHRPKVNGCGEFNSILNDKIVKNR